MDGGNKIASVDWLDAEDDEAAIELVKQRHGGYKCELWQGTRLVARIDLRKQD